MNNDARWQSFNTIEMYMAQWGDDTIVYNPLSGETHQLNLMAVDALSFLQKPATLQALAEHICSLYQAHDIAEINQHMMQLLEQFDDLGLITACRT